MDECIRLENIKGAELNEAKIIQNDFLDGRANRRSFGVSNNRFIPPHQFFGAEEYLKKIQKD